MLEVFLPEPVPRNSQARAARPDPWSLTPVFTSHLRVALIPDRLLRVHIETASQGASTVNVMAVTREEIQEDTSSNVTMHKPAIYRIRIRGHLDDSMSDQLSGMQITEVSGENSKAETILVGRLVDQAALSGVLNSLYELHMPVLSAECVDADS